MSRPVMERLLKRISKNENGCWVWLGCKMLGYGKIGVGSRSELVHRVTFEDRFGQIPSGLVVDHVCRNRACCNPEHLTLKTIGENVLADGSLSITARNSRATHCLRGHIFDKDNTRIARGRRYCRACDRIAHRKENTREA